MATFTEEQIDRVARAGLVAQKKLAWGNAWTSHFYWPDTPEQKRAYPHNPHADVDLAREFARAALKEISADRKPVKIDLSKEWCMKMAEREGNHEIGAGSLADQTDRQWAEAKAREFVGTEHSLIGGHAVRMLADEFERIRREGCRALQPEPKE